MTGVDGFSEDFISTRTINSFIYPAGMPMNNLTMEVFQPPVEPGDLIRGDRMMRIRTRLGHYELSRREQFRPFFTQQTRQQLLDNTATVLHGSPTTRTWLLLENTGTRLEDRGATPCLAWRRPCTAHWCEAGHIPDPETGGNPGGAVQTMSADNSPSSRASDYNPRHTTQGHSIPSSR